MPDTQLGQPQKTTAEILRHYFLTDEDVKDEYVCLLANGRSMSWILENINDELERLHPEAHRSSFSSLRKVWVGLGLPTQQQAAMARLPAASHPSLDDPCFEHLISSERDTLADWSDEPDGIDPLDGHDDELILDPEKMMDSLSPPVETSTRTGAEPAAAVARPSVVDEMEAVLQGMESKNMGLYLAAFDTAVAANPVLAAEVAALEAEITAEMENTERVGAAMPDDERHGSGVPAPTHQGDGPNDERKGPLSNSGMAPSRPTRKSRAAPAWIKDLRKSFRPPKAAPKRQEDVADIIAKELSGRRARRVLGELVLSRASTVENVARWLKERFEREHPKARKTSVKRILVLWREAGLPVRGKRNWLPSGN